MRSGRADLGNKARVPRPVQDDHGHVLRRAALGLGDLADVVRDRRLDVHHVRCGRPGDQLGHVEDRGRVIHRATRAHGEHRDRVRHPVGSQPGAVDRIYRDVAGGAAAVPYLLAVVEHRGAVLLALADHHHALHRDRVDERAHRVHRGAVGTVLVAPPHPPGGGHGAGLGHPDEFHGEVAVRSVPGLLRGLAYRDPRLAWDAVGLVICHGRRLPSETNTSERCGWLARPRLVGRCRGQPGPGAFEPL